MAVVRWEFPALLENNGETQMPSSDVIICIGNEKMTLQAAFDYCKGELICSEPSDPENLMDKKFSTPQLFLEQLQKDATTTTNTSETLGGKSVYIDGMFHKNTGADSLGKPEATTLEGDKVVAANGDSFETWSKDGELLVRSVKHPDGEWSLGAIAEIDEFEAMMAAKERAKKNKVAQLAEAIGVDAFKAKAADYASLFRLSGEALDKLISGEVAPSPKQLADFKAMAGDNKLWDLSDQF